MTCVEFSALIPLHLRGELDASRASGFAAHLENCSACAREVRNHRLFDEHLRACLLAETIETGALDRRIMQRIALEAGHPRKHGSRRFIFAAAGLAAVVLMTLFSYRAVLHPAATGVYAAAARDHHIEIVDRQPRRWRSDIASVEELGQEQGISASTISALVPPGYRLEEGKLCRLDGRLFLHLVFSDGPRNFSVFLRQEDKKAADRKRVYASALGAEHVAGFQSGTLKAMIVTNQPGNAALLLAKSAAAAI